MRKTFYAVRYYTNKRNTVSETDIKTGAAAAYCNGLIKTRPAWLLQCTTPGALLECACRQ